MKDEREHCLITLSGVPHSLFIVAVAVSQYWFRSPPKMSISVCVPSAKEMSMNAVNHSARRVVMLAAAFLWALASQAVAEDPIAESLNLTRSSGSLPI